MTQSLFEHGQITTTLPKAKDLRPFAEKIISAAVQLRQLRAAGDHAGALAARRKLHHLLGERSVIPIAHRGDYEQMSDAMRERTLRMASGRRHRTGDPKGRLAFTAESITHRLVESVAPRFADRPGGFTRIIRLAETRVGDGSPLAMLQLVGDEQSPGSLSRPRKTARKRRSDVRYAFAVKMSKRRPAKERSGKAGDAAPMEAEGAADASEST